MAACSTNTHGRLRALRSGDLPHSPVARAPYYAELIRGCGSGIPTAAGRRGFRRLPYLQKLTSTSVEILWTSATDHGGVTIDTSAGAALAGAVARVDTSAPLADAVQLTATLTELEPATHYCYRIVVDGEPWTEPVGFRTAPAATSSAAIRLVAFGDIGKRSLDQLAVRKQLAEVPFDLALVTGDVAYDEGRLSELEAYFFTIYAGMLRHIPFFVASGNHDYKHAGGAAFRQVFALFENGGEHGRERWYSLDWGQLHVVVLDSQKISRAQSAWLERDLANNKLPWTIAVMHHPPFSSGYHGSNRSVRRHFVPIFAKHKVNLVLSGHEHNYERTLPIRGVTYVVTGGGGRGTRPVGKSSFTAFSHQVSHFVHITIDDDQLRLVAIDATGAEFDSVAIVHGSDALATVPLPGSVTGISERH